MGASARGGMRGVICAHECQLMETGFRGLWDRRWNVVPGHLSTGFAFAIPNQDEEIALLMSWLTKQESPFFVNSPSH